MGEPHTSTHPVVACAEVIEEALKEIADVEPVFMGTDAKAAALAQLAQAETRLAALRLRVLASADDVAARDGARDAATWLSHTTRREHRAVSAEAHLAQALDRRWVATAGALARGELNLDQARVLVRALEELPDDLGATLLAQAEEHLIGQTGEFGPRELRILGRRILEVVAPDLAEAEEARRLADEEADARKRTRARFTRLGGGLTRFTTDLPEASAHRLETYLDAFTSPRTRTTGPAEEDRVPRDQQLGQAFCALIEHLDPARLPDHGGDATTVVVTIDLHQLLEEYGAGDLLDGDQITAAQARRLACTAEILPAVLDGDSQPLDLGRSARLFSRAQRKALRLRDKQCRAEGCTIPATWCEAHHRHPWSHGGKTDLADGLLLCSFHHHRAQTPPTSRPSFPVASTASAADDDTRTSTGGHR